MTYQELRIAKLAKILNSTWAEKNSANPAIQQAFGRAVNEMKETIRNEKDFNTEAEERQKMQARIEKQEEIMKENIRKHHFAVLKKQIEDRKRQKDIFDVEKLLEKPRPQPRTPPDPPKFFHRENLKEQIKEKRNKIKQMQKNELDMDRFLVKVSKISLDEDFKKKQLEKDAIYNDLKKSWENTRALNKLKKEADRLKFFGNVSLNRKFKPLNREIQKSSSKEKSTVFTPKITKKQSKSNIPRSEAKLKDRVFSSETSPQVKKSLKSPLDPGKKIEKTPENSPSKQVVLERLEKIRKEEADIQNSKKEILDYLSQRSKSKA